jgi:hypothetical protein
MPGAKMRALSRPVKLHAVGPGHSCQESRGYKIHFEIPQELAQNNMSRQKCQIKLIRRYGAL